MSDVKTLHDEDFFAWSKQQADALRAAARTGSNQALDWANLAEEIEDLGASQKSALHSQLRRIIRHLLKLENSLARAPRRGWRQSVNDARIEIDYLLETSPSLRSEIDADIVKEMKRGIKLVVSDLGDHGEIDPAVAASILATSYTSDQILDDWFPPELQV
jgi:hypothetical protein